MTQTTHHTDIDTDLDIEAILNARLAAIPKSTLAKNEEQISHRSYYMRNGTRKAISCGQYKGVSGRGFTDAEMKDIHDFLVDGEPIQDIADIYNAKGSTILSYKTKWGLSKVISAQNKHDKLFTDEEVALIKRMLIDGKRPSDISEHFTTPGRPYIRIINSVTAIKAGVSYRYIEPAEKQRKV